MELLKKFNYLFSTPERIYVNASIVSKEYKKTKGHSGATQVRMIQDLQVQHYTVVWRRGPKSGQLAKVDIHSDEFNYTTMNILIDINSIKGNELLVERIKALPDVPEDDVNIKYGDALPEVEAEPLAQENDAVETKPVAAAKSNAFNPPILELQDHEKFVDVNGDTFEIEVRGSYSRNGILFKAKDIEEYFEIGRMVDCMLRTDRDEKYVLGEDYVIIGDQTFPPNGGKSPSKIKDEDQTFHTNGGKSTSKIKSSKNLDHNKVFLTLHGLLRVIYTSKSGNANKDAMHEWIVGLVYKHKFGSKTERVELAKELTKDFSKHMLNKTISGLYYVDIGEMNDLYDPMQISKEMYPPETYGKHRICKFGLSEDIFSRVKDHKNAKSGYGRWSKCIEHKWSVMISPSQLSDAETHLKTMLKANDFTFDYTDPFEKKHKELVMVAPTDEPKLKGIYRNLLKLFPSKENELAEALSSAEDRYKAQIVSIKLECERKVHKSATRASDAELAMKDEIIARKDAEHKAEILGYQLQIERMKNGSG